MVALAAEAVALAAAALVEPWVTAVLRQAEAGAALAPRHWVMEAPRVAVAAYRETIVTDAFLVESMAPPPLAELVVGIRRDAQFGLAMTLGSGGILVELLADMVSLLLPATEREISDALGRLKVAGLLNGFRGRPAADRAALVAALAGLAEYAVANRATVAEIEINPLFVYETGVLAVDVLMQVDDVGA